MAQNTAIDQNQLTRPQAGLNTASAPAGSASELPLALDPAGGNAIATQDNPNKVSAFGGAVGNGQKFTLNDLNQTGASGGVPPEMLFAIGTPQYKHARNTTPTWDFAYRPREYAEGNYWSKQDARSGALLPKAQADAKIAQMRAEHYAKYGLQPDGVTPINPRAPRWGDSARNGQMPVPEFFAPELKGAKNPDFIAASRVNNTPALGDARAGLGMNAFRGAPTRAASNLDGAQLGQTTLASHLPGGAGLTGGGGRSWNKKMLGANPFGTDQEGGAGLQGGLPYFEGGMGGLPGAGAMSPDMPAYATGGVVGQAPNPMGMPPASGGQPGLQPGGAGEGGYVDHKTADMQINDLLARNPQVKQQIQQVIQQGIQDGSINPQMAQMAVQLAQACVQNPALYPQLRQFAIQRGIVDPEDLPEQYDQGLVLTILMAAKAAQGMGEAPQQTLAQNAQQQFAQGGMIQGPGTGTSDSVQAVNTSNGQPVKVSNGEYVVPAAVVAAKGRDFFDSLVRKYAEVPR